jgi:long-chain acyl-CoA synthetase
MTKTPFDSLNRLLEASVQQFGPNPSLSWVEGEPLTYSDLWVRVNAFAYRLKQDGIAPGDRVAILSHNMPGWGIAQFAILRAGAVIVPMLPDFTSTEISNILSHSATKAAVVSEGLAPKLQSEEVAFKGLIYSTEVLDQAGNDIPESQYGEFPEVKATDLAAIIYTSGTTGKSKGVMLTHKNIATNVWQGNAIHPVVAQDRFLSLLPLSHTLENTLSLILPLSAGASVYYLRKPPTPAVLLPALQKVKPTTILAVPLIIEKIYRNKVKPTFAGKPVIGYLYRRPVFRRFFHRLAGKSLMRTFGGQVRFFGIGGAKLNEDVELFLKEANFPYAIGYGLTECAPLLAGKVVGKGSFQSTGIAVPGVELKIHQPDPKTGEGEIWAKGPNIMQGYYQEPELTAEVFSEDGWFKTGDLGVFNKAGDLMIRGRSKSMIVGASGENIYPEEIESVINTFRYVVESVVIEQKGKLVALVHFNREALEEKYQHLKEEVTDYMEHKVEELKRELHHYVNSRVNKFSRIHIVQNHPSPFQKTATQKIKRFLYGKEMV